MSQPVDNPQRKYPKLEPLVRFRVPRPASLPIEDSRQGVLSDEALMSLRGVPEENRPMKHPRGHEIDTMAIMHVLEQIKSEMRTLVSEVSLMAQELANLRRLSTPARTNSVGRGF